MNLFLNPNLQGRLIVYLMQEKNYNYNTILIFYLVRTCLYSNYSANLNILIVRFWNGLHTNVIQKLIN